ncbi:hypothetical protein JCM10450v2_006585 [Rhodotorula kratochvilovae]
MNDRQQDELLALQAIYPDAVSWELLPDSAVEVRVVLPVEFEADKQVNVWDWVEPKVAKKPDTAVQDAVACLAGASLDAAPAAPAKEQGGGGRRRNRGGKNGGGGAGGSNARPARPAGQAGAPPDPTARAFQPRTNGQAPPVARDAPARQRSPAAPKPPVSPPPISSTGTPRIRFTPRPRSPPSEEAQSAAVPEERAVQADPQPRRLALRYLPSLHLSIRLPGGYPETEGPVRIELKEEAGWLDDERRKRVEGKLAEVYGGDECLFGIVDLVSSTSPDFCDTFFLAFPLVLRQSRPSSASASPLSSTLSAFNTSSSAHTFATTSHLCPLCFSPHRGSACIRLSSCGCVFCTPCLTDYFGLLITEGLVRSVACPSEGCVSARAKWEKEVGPRGEFAREAERPGRVEAEEVERLCGVEKRQRWEWLRDKVRVESDPTIAFCPRELCQAAVPKLSDDEEKLRVCPACNYSFCQFCKTGWHGYRNPCSLPQSSTIVSSYLEGDDAVRRSLEARYGASNIKRLVAAFEEERALRAWLDKNATECPGCSAWVQKSAGCNHMTCTKCACHFCYRCGKSIRPTDPYAHFNTPGTRCFEKLFDFAPGGEPDVGEWIGELLQDELAGF